MPSCSVCPSVTFVYCVETRKHSLFSNYFHCLVGSTILFFPYQPLWQYSYRDLNRGGIEYVVWQNAYFRPISRFKLKMIQDMAIIFIERHIRSIEWCHFQQPLMIPIQDFKVTPLFNVEYLINGTRQRHRHYETSQVKSSRFFENTNWQYAVAYNIDTI